MNRVIFAIVGLACFAGMAQAQFDETFNYADGNLTTLPGSPWQLWSSTSADSWVSGRVDCTVDRSDTIAPFANTLQTVGSSIDYGFDVNDDAAIGGTTVPNFSIVFAPATFPWNGTMNVNDDYNEAFGASLNSEAGSGGMASVTALEGQGGADSVNNLTGYSAGFMSTGTWHHFTGTVVKTATGATDVLYQDGVMIFSGTFALTDPRGINSVEITKSHTGGNQAHFALVFVHPGAAYVDPTSYTLFRGRLISGKRASLLNIDQSYMQLQPGITLNGGEAPIQLILDGTSPSSSATLLEFDLTARADLAGISQSIELYDWVAGAYVSLDTRACATSDTSLQIAAPNPNRFIQTGTNALRARVSFRIAGPIIRFPFNNFIDQAVWRVH